MAPSQSLSQSSSKPVAVVHGETITEDQLNKAAAADLAKAANANAREKLELQWKALNGLIEDKLIGLEAARDQLTKEQLIDIEIDSNIPTPAPEEVEAFYQANKARIPLPHDEAI